MRVLHDGGIGEGKVDAKLASGKAKDQILGMGTGHWKEEEVSAEAGKAWQREEDAQD